MIFIFHSVSRECVVRHNALFANFQLDLAAAGCMLQIGDILDATKILISYHFNCCDTMLQLCEWRKNGRLTLNYLFFPIFFSYSSLVAWTNLVFEPLYFSITILYYWFSNCGSGSLKHSHPWKKIHKCTCTLFVWTLISRGSFTDYDTDKMCNDIVCPRHDTWKNMAFFYSNRMEFSIVTISIIARHLCSLIANVVALDRQTFVWHLNFFVIENRTFFFYAAVGLEIPVVLWKYGTKIYMNIEAKEFIGLDLG